MGSSSECSLSLRLLGPFHLSIAGQEVPIESWKSRKALSLLKYLATRYGEKVPGDVLIDFLWPDSEYEAAVHTLHTTMYLLRKTLRDHTPRHLACHNWIEFSNGLYWLDTSQKVFIDVKAFSELYRESEDLEKTDPICSLEIGLDALQLYRGSFLPEDLYADWTETIRENCRAKYVELVLRTSRLLIECRGDYKGAARIMRTALQHAPYREDLHQSLMRCLMALGRIPEAILQYNICAKTLHDELDLEPSAETKALLAEIKSSAGRKNLPSDTDDVFVWDPNAFKSLLHLEQRRLERTKRKVVLLTIALDEELTSQHTREIFSAVTLSCRKSDVVTHWSKQLIVILLSETEEKGPNSLQQRITDKLGEVLASRCRFRTRVISRDDRIAEKLEDDEWAAPVATT